MESVEFIADFPQKIVALTGGIASGKSVIASIFEGLNCDIIDADIISRNVLQNGSKTHAELLKAFPDVSCEGVLCRQKLRKLVFDNYVMLQKLNSIMHPAIQNEMNICIKKAQKPLVVLVVPLLFETGMFLDRVEAVLCAYADKQTRIQRLINRDNIDVDLAEKIMRAQKADEYLNRCDYIINTEVPLETLRENVISIYQKLTGKKG